MPGPKDLAEGHEHKEVNTSAVYKFLIGLFVLAVVLHLALWGMFVLFKADQEKQDPQINPLARGHSQTPPAPRLQVYPILDLQAFRQSEQQMLTSYGWVDRQHGIVRIPVDQAIRIVLQKNLLNSSAAGAQTQTQPQTEPNK